MLLTKGLQAGPWAKQKALHLEGLEANLFVRRLVAGYGFGGFFLLGGVAVAIAVGMAITIAIAVTITVAVAVAAGWGDA